MGKMLDRMVRSVAVATALIAPASGAMAADTFKMALTQDAISMDPIATSDNTSIWVQLLIYDTLVRPSRDAKTLEPGLAESWTVSEDGLTYTFKLREAQWSDGQPVTADDVVYSLKRAGGENSDWGRFFSPITGFETPDDRTVVLKLDKPFTPLINNLALFAGAILPKAELEEKGDAFFETPIGSGPFELEAWNKGQGFDLAANDHYWQAGKPALKEVELRIVPEGNSRVLQLKAGEIDAAIELPLNQVKDLEAADNVHAEIAEVLRSDFVLMNTRHKPFDNEKVRQAMNYAVDKEGLVKGLLYGSGEVARSPLPPMAYADPSLEAYPYDVEKAKSLLAEAGFENGFSTKLLVDSGKPLHRQVAQALQSYFAAVGVKVEIQLVDGATHWTTTKSGDYDMAVAYATSDTIDPDQLAGFLIVNPERANAYHTEWKSERVNELYAKERETPDGPKREAQFQEMVKIAHDGAPSIFLFHPGAAFGYRDNVHGFKVLPTSNFRLEDVTVE